MWFDDVMPQHRPAHGYDNKPKRNPRYANGAARRAIRERWRAIGDPCHICGKPIDYSLGFVTDVSTGRRHMHPMAFVVDEIVPISRGGSPIDFANTQPTKDVTSCDKLRGGANIP